MLRPAVALVPTPAPLRLLVVLGWCCGLLHSSHAAGPGAFPSPAPGAEVVVTDIPSRAQFAGLRSAPFGVSVDAFKGIRFGTIAERFAPAAAPVYTVGQRINAHAFGPACYQPPPTDPAMEHGSEDCLFLNVYKPSESPGMAAGGNGSTLLPVALWIHGGGFVHGAGSSAFYDGSRFAVQQAGFVVVTINYRLGPLGFLCVDDQCHGGLNGVRDQIAALQWVQEHIQSFGGDPDAVTVFGESAGSLSACVLAVSPLARGLFHRAILESGSCIGQDWGTGTTEAGLQNQQAFLAATNASSVEALKDVARFPKEAFVWPEQSRSGRPSVPSVGGDVLATDPRPLFASGAVNVQDLMLGANTYDGLATWAPPSILPETAIAFDALLLEYFSEYSAAERAAIASLYSPAGRFNGSFAAAFVQLTGDNDVLCPSRALANSTAAGMAARGRGRRPGTGRGKGDGDGRGSAAGGGKVYFYNFGHLYGEDVAVQSGLLAVGRNASNWTSHGGEIPFVFGVVKGPAYFPIPGPPEDIAFTAAEDCLFRATSGLFASFMRTGTPTYPTGADAGPCDFSTAPAWPAWNAGPLGGAGLFIGAGSSSAVLDPSIKHAECAALYRSADPYPALPPPLATTAAGGAAAATAHRHKRQQPGPVSSVLSLF